MKAPESFRIDLWPRLVVIVVAHKAGESLLQVILVLGRFAILTAYTAKQFHLIRTSNLSCTLLNFLGAGILTVVAAVESP